MEDIGIPKLRDDLPDMRRDALAFLIRNQPFYIFPDFFLFDGGFSPYGFRPGWKGFKVDQIPIKSLFSKPGS